MVADAPAPLRLLPRPVKPLNALNSLKLASDPAVRTLHALFWPGFPGRSGA